MGMLVQGLNIVRDSLLSQIDYAALGTGTTQETAQDSALVTPIGVSAPTELSYSSDQYIEIKCAFPSTSAAGQDVTEVLFYNNSTGLAVCRVTFPASDYTVGKDLIITTRFYIKGGR